MSSFIIFKTAGGISRNTSMRSLDLNSLVIDVDDDKPPQRQQYHQPIIQQQRYLPISSERISNNNNHSSSSSSNTSLSSRSFNSLNESSSSAVFTLPQIVDASPEERQQDLDWGQYVDVDSSTPFTKGNAVFQRLQARRSDRSPTMMNWSSVAL